MTFRNPFRREVRVARDLLAGIPYHDCVDGDYGDEEEDYNDEELEAVNQGEYPDDWQDPDEPLHPEVADYLLKDDRRRKIKRLEDSWNE